ncbi:MAG: ABC transporter permease [Pseudomonadota bacterium]
MFAIAKRELFSLFQTPLAWLLLAVTQAVLAYVFLRLLQAFAQAQGQLQGLPGAPGVTRMVAMPLLETCAFVMMVLVPLLTMRAFAEEERARTLVLLLSAPVSAAAIVMGKFLGVAAFLGIIVGLTLLMPASLAVGTNLDFGQLSAGLLGLLLITGLFAALGLFVSSMTVQPAMAGAGAFGMTLMLWMLDWGVERASLFEYLSVLHHFRTFLRGLISTADLGYFLVGIALFLYLTTSRIAARRSPV